MSWHTCLVLIQLPDSATLDTVLERLGISGQLTDQTLTFEDATSMHSPGMSIGQVAGWAVICDPHFVLSGDGPARNQVWSSQVDPILCELSAGGSTVFGLITTGAIEQHGFTMYRHGKRERMWLIQGGEVQANDGRPLPPERRHLRKNSLSSIQSGLFSLLEAVCVSLDTLDGATFRLVGPIGGDVPGDLPPIAADANLSEEEVATLTAMLRHPNYAVFSRAAQFLRQNPNARQSLIPVLTALVESTNVYLQLEAAYLLEDCGPEVIVPVIPILTQLLSSDDPQARGHTARFLGGLGPMAKAAIPALIRLMSDKGQFRRSDCNHPIWLQAVSSIAQIDPQCGDVIPVLRQALKRTRKPESQASILFVIQSLGPHARPLLADLQSLEMRLGPGAADLCIFPISSLDQWNTLQFRVSLLTTLRAIDPTVAFLHDGDENLLSEWRDYLKRIEMQYLSKVAEFRLPEGNP